MVQPACSSALRCLGAFLIVVVHARMASADVLVVDPVAGPFTQIQAAVVAAQANDVILVHSGSYAPVTLDAKALTISADAGAQVVVEGTTLVQNIAAGDVVVLSGLTLRGLSSASTSDTAGVGLIVRDSGGFVRVQDCEIRGASGWPELQPDFFKCYFAFHGGGWDAVRVEACTATSFTACAIEGGAGADAPAAGDHYCCCGTGTPGATGLTAFGSTLALYEVHARGGEGGDNGSYGGPGGHGLKLSGSSGAVASSSVFIGGRGGRAFDKIAFDGGSGGDGARIDAGCALQHIGCTFLGGAGGSGVPPGAGGWAIRGSGIVFEFLVPSATLTMPRVVREGTTLALTAHGAPGALAALRIARLPSFIPIPSQRGVALVRQPTLPLTMLLGTLSASGMLSTSIPVTQLPSGIDSGTYYFQLAVHDATTGITLGSSYALLVLDSAF
jgi:hypothetical protein